MSWNGTHPVLSKAEARALLPPAACRRCVYLVRTLFRFREPVCSRCGAPRTRLLFDPPPRRVRSI